MAQHEASEVIVVRHRGGGAGGQSFLGLGSGQILALGWRWWCNVEEWELW